MDTIKLTVHEREETGNGPARRLRANGLIPGVTYGKGKAAPPSPSTSRSFRGRSGPRPQRRPRARLRQGRQGGQGGRKGQGRASLRRGQGDPVPSHSRATCCMSTCTRSTWRSRSKPRSPSSWSALRPAWPTAASSTGSTAKSSVRALPSDIPGAPRARRQRAADRPSPVGRRSCRRRRA